MFIVNQSGTISYNLDRIDKFVVLKNPEGQVTISFQNGGYMEKIGVYDTEANARLALDYVSYIINSGEPKLNIPTVKFVEGLKSIDSNIGKNSESAIAKLLNDIDKGFGGGFSK